MNLGQGGTFDVFWKFDVNRMWKLIEKFLVCQNSGEVKLLKIFLLESNAVIRA